MLLLFFQTSVYSTSADSTDFQYEHKTDLRDYGGGQKHAVLDLQLPSPPADALEQKSLHTRY